ncbi:MAG: hypothetical protein IPL55_13935, partial [Saprospiraceae bacterium]|nr:hypothetical protein [Saprospiraceae bacterium]
ATTTSMSPSLSISRPYRSRLSFVPPNTNLELEINLISWADLQNIGVL